MPTTPSNRPKKVVRAKKRTVPVINTVAPDPPEEGIDLSMVRCCPDCGLEVANEQWHTMWHEAQFGQLQAIQHELKSVHKLLEKALQGTAYEMPVIAVDPSKKGSHLDLTYWDEVKPNAAWDPTLMKRRPIDKDYYFKRRKSAEYHHDKVEKEKLAKMKRIGRYGALDNPPA